jgi:hypothetical protein
MVQVFVAEHVAVTEVPTSGSVPWTQAAAEEEQMHALDAREAQRWQLRISISKCQWWKAAGHRSWQKLGLPELEQYHGK